MTLGRRALLKATLGATQLKLLESLALPGRARAQATGGPTKLLTLFMPGGWMSPFTFCGLTPAQVATAVPAPFVERGEPLFFAPNQLVNLDGTTGAAGPTPPLRVPRLWNAAELAAGRPDPRTGGATSPNGWSWVHHRLWENTVAVHGVDQMTAAHVAGQVSALCGVASSDFKSPSLNAFAAANLLPRFPDRPLPSVWISGPGPASLDLRSEAAPARVQRLADFEFLFSDARNAPWQNLRARDVGIFKDPVKFDGTAAAGGFKLNPIEERSLRRYRAFKGTLNAPSEQVLQQVHDGLLGVSQVLARDVTSVISRTQGVQYTQRPFWAPSSGGLFAVDAGGFASDDGGAWAAQFDLALRLLKAGVTTSIAVECPGLGSYGFDNGHSQGHRVQFAHVRGTFEIVGRLLGEMKATPGEQAGTTLLDETLVVCLSDFGRTWPKSGPTSDHWPSSTVLFAGGGLAPNRMLGGYAVEPTNPNASGYDGVAVAVKESAGTVQRIPRSSDVVTTALAVLGVGGIRIPGGNGELLGVRAGT